MRSLLTQALLCVQAEAVVKSAQQAAAALANQEAAIAPDVALAVLQRLGRLGTSEASAKLEVCHTRYICVDIASGHSPCTSFIWAQSM